MCTAYEIGKRGGSFPDTVKASAVERLMGLGEVELMRPKKRGPVIMEDGRLELMTWGFLREMAGKRKKADGSKPDPVHKRIPNARNDTLYKWPWFGVVKERRCVIPVGLHYESAGPKNALRWYQLEEPSGNYTWVAGVWEDSEDEGLRYAALTTEPNAAVAPYHDRMLAVLEPHQVEPFLRGEILQFHPAAEDALRIWRSKNPHNPDAPIQEEFL